jgi:hypothetical protein
MKIERRKFRIGELAKQLAVERFVIRFWEKEFGIKGFRSVGGQRFYDEQDLKKFVTIKELLYEKGFTIVGAKKNLKDALANKKSEETKILASSITDMEAETSSTATSHTIKSDIALQIIELQKKLVKLRELL